MLSITEIRFLTMPEKAKYIWNNGTFYLSRKEGSIRINIYWMGNYYAELWYVPGTNQIQDVVIKDSLHYN